MTATQFKHAAKGFLATLLLGICLFGIPLALYGAWDAWVEPVEPRGKSGEVRTVSGRAAECFYIGAFLGGIAGAIAGVGVATNRIVKAR